MYFFKFRPNVAVLTVVVAVISIIDVEALTQFHVV